MSSLPPDIASLATTTGDAAHGEAVRDWLLALLRLAVTHDDADRAAALAAARGLDRRRATAGAAGSFRFFESLTETLGRAIVDAAQPDRYDILRRHIGRIADLRLRRAFAAAVDLEPAATAERPPPRALSPRKPASRGASPREALWRGLG